jgi:hypothetical protein
MMTSEQIQLRLLDNILEVASTMVVGKRQAERIVGGKKKLEQLYVAGKVQCSPKKNVQNGKWKFNLADVLRHCRRTSSPKSQTI